MTVFRRLTCCIDVYMSEWKYQISRLGGMSKLSNLCATLLVFPRVADNLAYFPRGVIQLEVNVLWLCSTFFT